MSESTGRTYCSGTSLSEKRVVILIGWLLKHSYNYTSLLGEILAGLSFDIQRIACLRVVSVNFKFSSILSQTVKWTFPVLVVFSKIWLVNNKTELRMNKQLGKSTRTALLFPILGSIVQRFFDHKLMFVFILCLYGQRMELYSHLEQNPEIKRSIPSLTFWYDFSSSSGEKTKTTEEIDRW